MTNKFLYDPPRFKIYAGTGQSIANAAGFVELDFGAEIYDTDGMHSTTTNKHQVVINTAGLWEFIFYIDAPSSITYTVLDMQPRKNGASMRTFNYGLTTAQAGQGREYMQTECAVGDIITLAVQQTSGAARTFGSANESVGITGCWRAQTSA